MEQRKGTKVSDFVLATVVFIVLSLALGIDPHSLLALVGAAVIVFVLFVIVKMFPSHRSDDDDEYP